MTNLFAEVRIISYNTALTADQCIAGPSANSLSIRAGSFFRNGGGGGQVRQVSRILRYPQSGPTHNKYDVAFVLLFWIQPLIFDDYVHAITLFANA